MHALYEVLSGQYKDGRLLANFPSHEDLLKSIHDSLQRILNARQGVLGHLPDYGLPDLDSFYRELPYSEQDIAFSVKQVIEKYEPRLQNVRVTPKARDIKRCVVRMEISGQLGEVGYVRFQTLFKSNLKMDVTEPNMV